MAYEPSVYRKAIQEKLKHIEISAYLQKYRSDILSKGKCRGHRIFDDDPFENVLWGNSTEMPLIPNSFAEYDQLFW